jgi:hypothetical protein
MSTEPNPPFFQRGELKDRGGNNFLSRSLESQRSNKFDKNQNIIFTLNNVYCLIIA